MAVPQPEQFNISERNSYLIKDSSPDWAYKLISEKHDNGYSVLCITRTDPSEIKTKYGIKNSLIWLTKQKSKDYQTSVNITTLHKKILDFVKVNKKSIVLLDRLDYLINIHGFKDVLNLIYSINDTILTNNATLLLPVNPLILTEQELTMLEQELKELVKPNKERELQDDLHEILVYLNNNERVSFKHISKEFSITKAPTRKRINRLQEEGLVVVRKNGRNKVVRITDKGRGLL